MLHSIEVPTSGDATLFVDQYAACNGLSKAMRRSVADLVAVRYYGNPQQGR